MEYIVAANGALAFLETLLPLINQAVAKGQVPAEKQAEVAKRIAELRTDAAWAGPEWVPSTTTP